MPISSSRPFLRVVLPVQCGGASVVFAASLLLAGCGGEATVVGESQASAGGAATNVVQNQNPPPAAPNRTAAPAVAAPAKTAPTRSAPTRTAPNRAPTLRNATPAAPRRGRADSAEVTAYRAVRDRRAALGLPASPSPDEDRTATVQLLGADAPLPGLAGLARDALVEAFPSQISAVLLEGETPEAPPIVYLADLPDPAASASAAEFLKAAEPVAGPEAEDFAVSRTVAVRIDAAALHEAWLTEANAPTPAATLTLRVPPRPAAAETPQRMNGARSSSGQSSNPFRDAIEAAVAEPTELPPTAATVAEAVRREAFALGPDGDPNTADTRTPRWTVLALPRPDAAPAPRDAAGESGDNAGDEGGESDEPVAFLLVAGPLEDPAAWLSAVRPHLAQGDVGVTFLPPASGGGGPMPSVLAATAGANGAPQTLPSPADGDALGWAFDLTVRQEASGGGRADAAPAAGEAPRDWALRALAEGSPLARATAARFLAAIAPPPGSLAPDTPAPEGADEVRVALLEALPKPAAGGGLMGGEASAGASPEPASNNPFRQGADEDNNPFRVAEGDSGGSDGEPGRSGGGFVPAPDVLNALLRWSWTPEHYTAAGEAAAAGGPLRETTLTTILDRVKDDPAAAAALAPLANAPGAGAHILRAAQEPGAPAEPVAMALLDAEPIEVRTAATALLAEIGTPPAAARLAEAARFERDRDLAKEMRRARIPILDRARD